jgi:hypothetical protein
MTGHHCQAGSLFVMLSLQVAGAPGITPLAGAQ